MDSFMVGHRDKIVGALSCFDRRFFKGHLPIKYSRGFQDLLSRRGTAGSRDATTFQLESCPWSQS